MHEHSGGLYQQLIEQSPDPIITLDLLGTIRFVNAAAEEASMYQAHELVGKHFTRTGILTTSGVVKAVQEFALVVAGQTRPPVELEVLRKDQSLRVYEAHKRLLQLSESGPTVQVVFRDVTQRKELEEALKRKNAALEELNRVMMSREERLRQMQREVNALLGQLNRPPKYQNS